MKEKEFPFEQALKRLEGIVRELEDETIELELALKKYEEGVRLARLCNNYLEKAEARLKILAKDEKDRPLIQDVDTEDALV